MKFVIRRIQLKTQFKKKFNTLFVAVFISVCVKLRGALYNLRITCAPTNLVLYY